MKKEAHRMGAGQNVSATNILGVSTTLSPSLSFSLIKFRSPERVLNPIENSSTRKAGREWLGFCRSDQHIMKAPKLL